jgi:gluconolactonase
MHVDVVCTGLEFPEGPIAMNDGSVILVEIAAARVTRVEPNGRKEVLAVTGGGPNGAAIGPDGALWLANNGGHGAAEKGVSGSVQRLDLRTGALETVFESCDGKRLHAPNDLVFDRGGGLWFTDHGAATPDGRLYGAAYYARPDGSQIRRATPLLASPNGIGLSPDEKVLYVPDTYMGRLWAFDVTGPGEVAPPPRPFSPGRVVANLPGAGALDSMAVEAGGKACVATIGLEEGGVTVFDPDGSQELVAFPDRICTNICFGGADMRDAWVTGSGSGSLFRCRWPRPGLKLAFNA